MIENTRINLVKCQKHLGITLSADCKWSKHINTITEKTSKQVAVLRKPKFNVSQNLLETMYLTYIRPLYTYIMQERFGIIVLSSTRKDLKIIILKPHI